MGADKKVEALPAEPPKGKRGLYVVLGGVACEVLGFVLLSQGSMTLAPLLLIGSFVVMGVGIWLGWD
jgi:hypothetical protein